MADYIYLLQNRLTPAQWAALEAVRDVARAHSMPVFLAGGAVRDLTTGTPVRDLDFAVQGDIRTLLGDLEGKGAVVAGENAVLASAYLTFRGGVRVEVAPTQTVTYPKPGKAETKSAPILDDLRRRDFTANAMAVSLNEGSYGLLLDPLNGTADIENRELRLVSAYGFIEQPALLLRAARLGERLGWSLETRTQSRYETSKEEEHIKALPDADRRYELEEVLHEEDPLGIIEHMKGEGWIETLFPALRAADGDQHALDEVRELIGQLEGQGLHPDAAAIFFPLVTAKMSDADRTALKAAFARQGFAKQIDSLEGRAKELASQLTAKSAALPSEAWRILHGADPEAVLYLAYYSRSSAVQSKIKAFLKDWPQMRQKIPYALMQEMRITPELPGYSKLLDDLFFALIDGKVDTTEAMRAFLEPYSPPAPVQVAARRRPAKATRSRAKRGAVEETVEAAGSADEDDEDEDEDNEPEPGLLDIPGDEEDDDDEEDEKTPELDESEDDDTDDEEDDDESEPDEPKVAKKAAPSAKAKSAKAGPVAKAAANKAEAPATAPEKSASKAAKKETAGAKASDKEVAPAKAAPKVVVKEAAKASVKAAAPAKQVIKIAASKVPAKASAKAAPVPVKKSAATKAPTRAAVKERGGK